MAKIDEKFYRGEDHPTAHTVGELKQLLSELPDELGVQEGFNDGVRLVVYNHGRVDERLEFEEIDLDGG
jgi:hypothetical protein